MNLTKKLITTLVAGATLGLAGPVFADSWKHDRGYDHRDHYSHYDRRDFRDHYSHYDRRDFRGHDRRVVVVQQPYVVSRPYVVAQPTYYAEPAPSMGFGAMIGSAIGTLVENQYNQR